VFYTNILQTTACRHVYDSIIHHAPAVHGFHGNFLLNFDDQGN